MPWKNCTKQEQRWSFVCAVRQRRQSFAACCRGHRISRKTGYKWLKRCERGGYEALQDRSRRPKRPAGWSAQWQRRLLEWRRRRPTWGARKLADKLRRLWPRQRRPAVRTLQRWLAQAKLTRRRAQRAKAGPVWLQPPRQAATRPNDVWTVDFKGAERRGGGVEPLTVFDLASRYGLGARLLAAKDYGCTRRAMRVLFRRYGLPRCIWVDNGPPFGGGGSLGLSRLSVEWVRLGIPVRFGRPAHPQDNAAHERWHRTLQEDLAAGKLPITQTRLNRCLHLYNTDRAHEALGMSRPVQCYCRSRRRYRGLPAPRRYPAGWRQVTVGANGYAWWAQRARLFGAAFAKQRLGLRPVAEDQWEVYLDYTLIGLVVTTDRAGMRPLKVVRPKS